MTLRIPSVALAVSAALLSSAPGAQVEEVLPPDFELVKLSPSGQFKSPIDIEFAPDGTLFVAQKNGVVKIHVNGALQEEFFLDLRDEVNNWGDRGLLGMVHHPGFVADGGDTSWVYLLYTVSPVPGEDQPYKKDDKYSFSRLTRYRALTVDGDVVADVASRHVLLGNQEPTGAVPDCIASLHGSHSNGSMVFGADGTLLVATGDGAHWDFPDMGGADPAGFDTFTHPETGLLGPTPAIQDSGAFRSQDLRSLSGKILRLNPETGEGYPSNPFFDGDVTSNASRVWALGLRSPFRATLKPGTGSANPTLGLPGELYIADVGDATWEEINVAKGGENFGWPCDEGPFSHPAFESHDHGSNPNGYPDCLSPNAGVPTGPLIGIHHALGVGTNLAAVYYDDNDQLIPGGFIGLSAISGAFYDGKSYPEQYTDLYFLADYSENWIKTIEFDALGLPVAARDFADNIREVVDIETHPANGDLFIASLKSSGRVYHLRHALNLTPIAVAQADPTTGGEPLTVQFDGTASSDPDLDLLTYLWDFGDGVTTSTAAAPQHTYATPGVYEVLLEVSDPGGLTDFTELQIAVGTSPPTVEITSHVSGMTFAAPEAIQLAAVASDADGHQLYWTWTIDQHHNTHVHPSFGTASQEESFEFEVDMHGEQSDLVYYRIQVEVEDELGLIARDHVYLLPEFHVHDVTGEARAIAKLFGLSPPVPQGTGNPDFEVVRDGVTPAPGSAAPDSWFDSSHGGDQGADDWLGWELVQSFTDDFRFFGLEFQEGQHFADGGWFETLDVEVRDDGAWTSVENLAVTPDYPFGLAGTPGFDGSSFDTYSIRFDPIQGDAVRLRGDPGGSSGFVSAGELRVLAIHKVQAPYDGTRNVAAEGALIAKVHELSPPEPTGDGSLDPGTVTNGTLPEIGSASSWAQYDTEHPANVGEDWIGLAFPTSKSVTRIVYQEGLNDPDGGWFDSFTLEVRGKGEQLWTPVTGLTVSPPAPGTVDPGSSYEVFDLDFDTVIAREFRLRGPAGGTTGFVSVGEFGVYVESPEDCGFRTYAAGGAEPALGAHPIALDSYSVPSLGAPVVLEVVGFGEPGVVVLNVGPLPAEVQIGSDTLLVDPKFGYSLIPLPTDDFGELIVPLTVPSDPLLAGSKLFWQAFGVKNTDPINVLSSNGLAQTFCP